MGIDTFAAVYIGSYEVSIKIFEMSARKKMRDIDYVRRRIELGRDAYSAGRIGYPLVEELCDTLREFVKIMKSYKVQHYEVCAAAVIREASNELFILDQIKRRTGLSVRILSNSEYRFICYKAIAMQEAFEEMIQKGAAVVDVGGAGLQITIFSKGKVITTQHLGLGTMRMREQLSRKSSSLAQYETQIEEMVEKELAVFRAMYMKKVDISYLILAGDYVRELACKVEKKHNTNLVESDRFARYLEKLERKSLEQISEDLGLLNERDALIVPYMVICRWMAEKLGAGMIWSSGALISDGIACDYAERNRIYKVCHDFEEDIISAAKSLSDRYMSYSPHIDALTQMSTQIFDSMKKEHGMGNRERLLLRVAAILHDCGKYISLANGPECSYNIIMACEIMGLTHRERQIVANTVLYNTYPLVPYEEVAEQFDEETYLTVAKLSAILRVANAMDRSHRQKFKNVKTVVRGRELVITIETAEDLALERTLFDAKTAFFEDVFCIRPVIREKRVYS